MATTRNLISIFLLLATNEAQVIHQCDEYSDSGVVIRPGCVRDVDKTCDISCNGGGDMKILCNVNRQWEKIHHDVSCVPEDAAFKMFVLSLDDRVSKEEMKLLADHPWTTNRTSKVLPDNRVGARVGIRYRCQPSFEQLNEDIDLCFEIYAVGVGEEANMQELQDLVSFPRYQHLVHASEGTVACDG
ncbi:hypothetical protein CHS0354_013565 [Potamilus streckersoni]|uniref:Uncharacterized protein n=1 Tax=Potamilus streckersoni TaxID=2493646 RepID=A0AAE0VYI8_9BIVA|nr:hypothetical protein CHS0354_013565 [Potamilus streckersoni]